MQKQDLITIRDMIPEDNSFIFATFLRGLYYGDSWFSLIPKNIFMDNYHKVLQHILLLQGVRVRVSCLKDDPEVILGYIILSSNDTKAHFLFVKKAWRGIGIATTLTPPTVTTVTHLTSVGIGLLKKRPKIVFNPFALN